MKPVVSVLLPVCNGEAYLKPAIESVLNQTFCDWELFVGDNASTDGTRDIIESYRDPRIRIHRHTTNIGMAPNWDFLLQKAQGDYACLLGADDLLAPNHLARKISLLVTNENAPFVHGATQFIDSNGNELPSDDFQCAPVEYRMQTLTRFLKINFVNITSVVFRMAFLRRSNLGFEPCYSLMPDWALLLKLAALSELVIYDEQRTAFYRIHQTSVARIALNTFHWSYESTRLRVDNLMKYQDTWRQVGINPEHEASSLTKPLWRLAFQQARRGNFANARKAWHFFRELHSSLDVIRDLPEYVKTGFQKLKS